MTIYHAHNGTTTAKKVDQNPLAITIPPTQMTSNRKLINGFMINISRQFEQNVYRLLPIGL